MKKVLLGGLILVMASVTFACPLRYERNHCVEVSEDTETCFMIGPFVLWRWVWFNPTPTPNTTEPTPDIPEFSELCDKGDVEESGKIEEESGKVIEIGDKPFDEVIKSSKVVVVDYTASWCMPCQMLKPRLEEMAKEYKDKGVVFYSVDIDARPDLKKSQVPTVEIYSGDSGELNGSVVGLDENGVKNKIENVINK